MIDPSYKRARGGCLARSSRSRIYVSSTVGWPKSSSEQTYFVQWDLACASTYLGGFLQSTEELPCRPLNRYSECHVLPLAVPGSPNICCKLLGKSLPSKMNQPQKTLTRDHRFHQWCAIKHKVRLPSTLLVGSGTGKSFRRKRAVKILCR